MPRRSAGLLMYRIQDEKLQVILAHPGGPFFKKKDEGDWSIPKGETEPEEDLLAWYNKLVDMLDSPKYRFARTINRNHMSTLFQPTRCFNRMNHISVTFGDGNKPPVLDHISLSIVPNEIVAVLGPSGCGKSTLMRVMVGLLRPTAGEV